MKALSKILIAALVLALLVCAFAFVVSAEDAEALDVSAEPFEVGGEGYASWAEAYAAAGDGATIKLTSDYVFQTTDFTEGLNYKGVVTFFDASLTTNGNQTPLQKYNDIEFAKTAGILIDKNITIDLGGHTLLAEGLYSSANSANYGVLFYLAQGTDYTLTVKGRGKIASDITAFYVMDGDVVIDGDRGDIVLEYTGTDRIWHIKVGVDQDGSAGNVNTKNPTLTLKGDIVFNATETVPGVLDNSAVPATSKNYNLHLYSVMSVAHHSKIVMTDADITNTVSDGATVRALVTSHLVAPWSDDETTAPAVIDVDGTMINHTVNSPVFAYGHNTDKQSNWARRTVITVDDSEIVSAATTKWNSIFKTGHKGSFAFFEINVNRSKLFVEQATIVGAGDGGAMYGSIATFTDCYVDTVGSGNGGVLDGVSAIFDRCQINFGTSWFAAYGMEWYDYTTDDALEATLALDKSTSAISVKLALPNIARKYGGYGMLIKEGCTIWCSNKAKFAPVAGTPGVYDTSSSSWAKDVITVDGELVLMTHKYIDGSWTKDGNYAVLKSNNTYEVRFYEGLDSAVSGTVYKDMTSNPKIGTLELAISKSGNNVGRHGLYTIYTADDGNKYFTHQQYIGANNTTEAPYAYIPFGVSHSNGNYGTHSLENFKYYSLDWDMMTPTGVYDDDYRLQTYFYSYDGTGALFSNWWDATNIILKNDVNGPYWQLGSDVSENFDRTPGVWHHFTYVIEMIENPDVLNDYSTSKCYLFCDGELIGTFSQAMTANAINAIKANGKGNSALHQFRFQFAKGKAQGTTGGEAAFDNFAASRFAATTDFTIEDVANNLYNFHYKPQYGITKIEVDGVKFDSIDKGIDEIREGSEVTLYADYEGTYVPTMPHTVNKNGKAFSYTTGGTGLVADVSDETVTFRWTTAADVVFTVGENKYGSFIEAYNAVAAGGVITLNGDYVFKSKDFTDGLKYINYTGAADVNTIGTVRGIAITKNVTVDLNGHSLTSVGNDAVLFHLASNQVTLNIVGPGTIAADVTAIAIADGGNVNVDGNGGIEFIYTGTRLERFIKVGLEGLSDYNSKNPTLNITGKVDFISTGAVTVATTNGSSNNEAIYAAISVQRRGTVSFNNATVSNRTTDGATPRTFINFVTQGPWGGEAHAAINVVNSTIDNPQDSSVMATRAGADNWVKHTDILIRDSVITSAASTEHHPVIRCGKYSTAGQGAVEIVIEGSTLAAPNGNVIASGSRDQYWSCADAVTVTVDGESRLTASTASGYIFGYAVSAKVEAGAVLRCKDVSINTIAWIDWNDPTREAAYNDSFVDINNSGGAPNAAALHTYMEAFGGYGIFLEEGVYVSSPAAPAGTKGVLTNGKNHYGVPEGSGLSYVTEQIDGETVGIYKVVDLRYVFDTMLNEDLQGLDVSTLPIVYYDQTANFMLESLGLAIGKDGSYVGRTGKYYVYLADDGKNIYLTHTPYRGANNTTETPYAYISASKTHTNGNFGSYSVENYNYYSIDFDMMTPTGVYEKFSIVPYFRLYNSDGSNPAYALSGNALRLYVDAGGNPYWGQDGAATVNGEEGSKTATFGVEAGEWCHVTYIIETDHSDYTKYNAHLYINGELLATFGDIDLRIQSFFDDANYTNTAANMAFHEYRLLFEVTDASTNLDGQIALDNIVAARYGLGFTAGLDTSSEIVEYISGIVYNEGYDMPYGVTKAEVNDKKYDNLEDALAALREGDTLTLYVDYDGIYNPAFAHTVITSKYFEYYSEIYVCDRTGSTYVFRIPTDSDVYTVTWYKPDGTVLTTTTHKHGETATPPTYDASATTSNGWLKFSYEGWSLTKNGSATDNFLILESTEYYAAVNDAIPYLSDAMYNLALYGNVQVNLFVPDSGIPDGVRLLGVYYDHDSAEAGINQIVAVKQGISAKGRTYSQYVAGDVGATALTTKLSLVVKFTYGDRTLYQTITMSPYSYAENILSRGPDTTGATVVADLVRYSNELTKANGKTDVGNSQLEALLTSHGYTTDVSGITFPTSTSDYSALSPYIDNISFNVAASEPSYYISFKDDSYVTGVSISMEGWLPNETETVNFGYIAYGIDAEKSSIVDGYYEVAQSASIPIYNIDQTITITLNIKRDTGVSTTVSGTYDLNAYYNGIAAGNGFTETDIGRYKSFLVALRAYATSASEYRYGTEKLTRNATVVNYADYGAKGDGVTDDFNAIRAAHEAANELANAGEAVVVKGTPGATYYIGADNDTKLGLSIIIMTDTDWTDVKFIIDDSKLTAEVSNEYILGVDGSGKTYDELTDEQKQQYNQCFTPIFIVADDDAMKRGQDDEFVASQSYTKDYKGGSVGTNALGETVNIPSSLAAGSTNIGFAPGFKAFVKIRDNGHKNYVRFGPNATNGGVQHEIVLVDEYGNIDSSTPLAHDFYNISYVKVWNVEVEPITVKGGHFTTIYNKINSYSYLTRGINVIRPNTVVDGLVHDIDESSYVTNKNSAGRFTGASPMSYFLGAHFVHNVKFKNCDFEGQRFYYTANDVLRGTYEIGANLTNMLTLENVQMTNLYEDDDGDGVFGDTGFMGTNFCKNFNIINSKFKAFDAHTGLHNLYVYGSEILSLNLVGSGTAHIENTTLYARSTQQYALFQLREDYGSNFAGDIYIKNVNVEVMNDAKWFALIRGVFYNYNTGLYYGEDAYYSQDTEKGGDDSHYYSAIFPQNVVIDGLTARTGAEIVKDPSGKATISYGTADSSVKIALLTSYAGSASDNYERGTSGYKLHEYSDRGIDITTYGSTGKLGGLDMGGLGIWGGTSVTVNHPVKMTESVTISGLNGTFCEYIYGGTTYDLSFLNPTITRK